MTPDYLGADADDALEVLCAGCLEGRDAIAQDPGAGVALRARIISAVLAERRLAHFSDIIEEVKCRLVAARIPYQGDELPAAITRLISRFPADTPPQPEPAPSPATRVEFSRTEAVEMLAALNAAGLIKPMPAAPLTSRRAADRRIVARQLATLMLDQVQRCEDLERAPDAVEPEPTTTEGTMEEQIGAQAPALTDAPDGDVALEYLAIAKQALSDALRDKTDAVATIAARFERLCSDEGKPYDADLTRRAVAAAIAARDRALDAFAAQVRAFVKPMPNAPGHRLTEGENRP